MNTKGKQPAAITAAIQGLVKLAEQHGLEAVHLAYSESIAECMACRERDVWRSRITEGQREFALLERD